MADITTDFWQWSSTASNNSPSGSTAVGTGLDDNLRAIQAAVRAALEALTSVAGTNTVTASMAGLTAYVSGMTVRFVPANSNTGAATININSLGAKSIFLNGAALVGFELRKNCPVMLYYDGTQFNILSGAHGDGIPIGTISDRAYSTAPSGQLLCDGSAVSRTTYADLFAAVGTTWGAGDGSSTFNVPSLARRVTVGSGGSGTGTLGSTVGSTGGEETHTLTTAEIPSHTHSYTSSRTDDAGSSQSPSAATDATFRNQGAATATGAAGSGGAHNNMQPSAVVYKCIKF